MKVERSIETTASPQRVWPLLIEPQQIVKWFTLLKSFEYTSDPPRGVGTTFHYEEQSGGRLMKLDYRVTDWVENERLAFSVESGPLRKDDQVWSLAVTPGGSKVTLWEDVALPGGKFGDVVLAPVVGRMIGGHLAEMLMNLKRLAEA